MTSQHSTHDVAVVGELELVPVDGPGAALVHLPDHELHTGGHINRTPITEQSRVEEVRGDVELLICQTMESV